MPAEAAYTHVGRRAWTGFYAVGADAYRTPGKVHALNPVAGRTGLYAGLCGVTVAEWSDDHHLQDERQAVPATAGHRITCKRCRNLIEKGTR